MYGHISLVSEKRETGKYGTIKLGTGPPKDHAYTISVKSTNFWICCLKIYLKKRSMATICSPK